MRWLLVLAVLLLVALGLFMARLGGPRGARAELPVAEAKELARRTEQLLAAEPVVEEPSEAPPETARKAVADEAPRVRGVVRAEDGRPLGEDVVLLADAYPSLVARPETLAIPVAADGTFVFLPPPGTSFVTLELRAESLYTPTELRAEPGDEVVVVALRRDPEGEGSENLVVSGRVLDQHRLPFANATVYTGEPGETTWTGSGEKTDADGRFELRGLARQRWRIGISSEESFGRTHLDVDGTLGDVHGLEFTLERGGCIEGTVRWRDGTPVSDFEVRAKGERMTRMSTFEGGEFRICGLSDALDWKLEITAESGQTKGLASATGVRTGGPRLDLVLDTQDTFAVEVIVKGPKDEAVSEAKVSGYLIGDFSNRARATGCGSVQLTGLTSGEWLVSVKAKGYDEAEQRVALAPGSPALEFRLARAGLVRGVVLDGGGNVVPEAKVFLADASYGSTSMTDEEGRFEISGTGTHLLRAKRAGLGASSPREVTFLDGQVTEGVVLRLAPAARIDGRLLDEHREPLADAWVWAGLLGESAQTGADGAFVFEGLSAGTVELSAFHVGREAKATVTLIAGQTSTVELRLRAPDPVRVHGRATLGGKPFAGPIWFRGQDSFASAECDADGRFEVTLPFPGSFEVTRRESESSWSLTLTVPDVDEHELTLDLDTMR